MLNVVTPATAVSHEKAITNNSNIYNSGKLSPLGIGGVCTGTVVTQRHDILAS